MLKSTIRVLILAPIFGGLLPLIVPPATAQTIPAQDEFVGPFASWLNVKTQYGATGDGSTDDTTAIQNCINALGTGQNCFFPAGTYKISLTLHVGSKTKVGLIGADPSTVQIKWAGTAGQAMIWINGCNACRFERLTLNGSNVASTTGFMSKFDHVNHSPNTSKNMYYDDVLINLDKGLAAGGPPPTSQAGQQAGATYCWNDDSSTMRRLVFNGMTTAGVSVECVNALLWTCWDCTFTNNARGMTNEFGNGGTFAAFRSVFTGSSIADITIANNYYFWTFEDNWSVGSNQFFKTTANNSGNNVLLRGNHVINTAQNASFDMEDRGPFVLVDNVILTKSGNTGPVFSTGNSGAMILSIGNTFTVNNKISGGVSREIEDQVVSPSSVSSTPPTPPPADPNLSRTIYDVPAGASASTIQTAINNAVSSGNRSVVHLPAGTYNISSTITIPSNTLIQIIGDGWGTQLNWTGGPSGVVFDLYGPSLAKLDALSLAGGSGNADLIKVENSDQVGGHVYGGFIESDDNGVDYLADGTGNSNVDLEYGMIGVDSPSNVGIRAIGGGGSNRIAMFGSDSGNTAGTLYSVRSGGSVIAENIYYEGGIIPLVNMGSTENGNLTLAGHKGGVESGSCSGTPTPAAYEATGMTGKFVFLSGSSINCGSYQTSGSNSNQQVLFAGVGYVGTNQAAGYVNGATAGTSGFFFNSYHDSSGNAIQATDLGTTSDAFITSMLSQWRGIHSSYLAPQTTGTTNVRIFRTLMRSGLVGLHVMPGGGSGGTTSPAETTPPSTPGSLLATASSASQMSLTWTASTDNVGVTGYLVERCPGRGCTSFAQIATTSGTTTYNDTGLAANISYSYRVRATDAAGNLSSYSNVASATTQQGTTSGLVAAYGFNEGTGSTVTDSSGNGNTGTITNAIWTAGKYGSALTFNGTNALVTINDAASLHLTTAMTLEAWVNPGPVVGEWEDVIYKGKDNYFLEAASNKSVPASGAQIGTANVLTYGTAALPQNTWSHVALTYDGVTLRLYVNGVQVSSLAQTGNILTSTDPLQIGGDSVYGQFFNGTIDEVRIYNVALTATQIQTDMNAAITLASCGCDVNGDGVVNIVDVQIVTNQSLGLTPSTCGLVTATDVQKVVNAALGLGCTR